ncbi:MAG TPA: ribonuclease R, partial [Oligoflexia bacterium]|nr:ribonuclease R [Oligoflexia bacterium]
MKKSKRSSRRGERRARSHEAGKKKPTAGFSGRPPEKKRKSLAEQARERNERHRAGKKTGSQNHHPPGKNLVILQGAVQKNRKGFGFLLQEKEDVFIPPELAANLLTGDKIRMRYNPRSREAIGVELVERGLKQFIGTYHAGFSNRFVELVDRTMREEVNIPHPPAIVGLRHGDKVLVEVTKYRPKLEGRIVRSFGPKLAPKFDTLAVVVRSNGPQEFSQEASSQAERLSVEIQERENIAGYPGRKDLREKHFVTIDGKDARDFDDAVLVEKTDSGYVLYVAIADVGEFVRPGDILDEEAYARATSVYFPEWVIPMLPEALSNGACSLRPNEEKLTLTCEMHFDLNGKKRSERVYESVIRSHRRCIYEDVQKEYDSGDKFWAVPYELYRILRTKRIDRGALDLDLPEAKIILDENSDTIDIQKTERLDSHRLIEEFMIAANEAVSELMERDQWPFVYRVHEPPQAEALERFDRFASALGLKPKLGDGASPKLFSNFLSSIKENPYLETLSYLMLRSLKQARYEPSNLKHFGLASRAYSHFTSPIRRYPDLMVHRILKRYVRRKPFHGGERNDFEAYLDDACLHCSTQERKAQDLDRTVTKIKKARFMEKHLGKEFEARVYNVGENGLYVELKQWFIEGLVP